MECPPLYVERNGKQYLLADQAWTELETARKKHRRAWNRGYLLEQQGSEAQVVKAQTILDRANQDLNAAELRYLKAREA